jgi:tRNA(Ile)-lysidine synthase
MAELTPDWLEGRFLCAFSGGSDSTALLSLLAQSLPKNQLLAFHLDHSLRPSSRQEAVETASMAAKIGVECLCERIDAQALAKRRGKGVEEAARAIRYELLDQHLNRWGGDWIVTAHHAEDLVETVILKLARGVGPSSLVGIPAVNGKIIRPLLSFSKKEILAHLNDNALSWVDDPSNLDGRFKRNQVRKEIVPEIEKLNPAYLEAFRRASKLASAEEAFWENHLEELQKKLVTVLDDGDYQLEVFELMRLSLAEKRRLVGKVLRMVEIPKPLGGEPVSFASVDTLLKIAQQPGAGGVDLPGGRRVQWWGRFLRIGLASRYRAKIKA